MSQGQTTDAKKIKRQAEREERKARRTKDNWAWIMRDARGRSAMYDLIFGTCGVMTTYTAQDSGIYRHEGRRGVGFELAKMFQMHLPAEYVRMMSERIQEESRDLQARELDAAGGDGDQT